MPWRWGRGGRFRLLFCALDDFLHPIHFAIKGTTGSFQWHHYFENYKKGIYSFRRKDYIAFALEAGIAHFEITPQFTESVFENSSAFADWILGWLQEVGVLPESLHRLFAEEVAFRYAQYPDMSDERGRITFRQKLWLISGAI